MRVTSASSGPLAEQAGLPWHGSSTGAAGVAPAAPPAAAADNGGLPYGTKTEAEVAARKAQMADRIIAALGDSPADAPHELDALASSRPEWQLIRIVVNDGSSDGTAALLAGESARSGRNLATTHGQSA